MSEELSDQQIEELKEAFNVIDVKNTGVINVKELPNLLKYIGHNPTEEETKILTNQLDAGGSGSIDFPEFLAYVAKKQRSSTTDPDELFEAMSVFDKDDSGFLNKEVVEFTIQNIGDGLNALEIQEFLESINYDEHGKISYDDFKKLIMHEN